MIHWVMFAGMILDTMRLTQLFNISIFRISQ